MHICMYIASGQRMHVGSQFHFILAGSVPVDGILSYLFIYLFFCLLNFCLLLGRGVKSKIFSFLCHSLVCFLSFLDSNIPIFFLDFLGSSVLSNRN